VKRYGTSWHLARSAPNSIATSQLEPLDQRDFVLTHLPIAQHSGRPLARNVVTLAFYSQWK
jgi:hypothetical protein